MSNYNDQTKSLESEKIDLLLQLLICPKTGGKLKFDRKYQVFVSEKGNLVFHYENGIPNMVLEDAESMDNFYSDKTFDNDNLVYAQEECKN